jgi:integrase
MRTHGNPEAYVLAESWKSGFFRSQPYLLRREEISLFFQSATGLETTSPWKWQSVAFFALMHSCGLRTCETRRLQSRDVDLAKGFIDVLWSKGNRSRRLPISGQIIDVLADCDHISRKRFGQERPGVFVSSTPAPVIIKVKAHSGYKIIGTSSWKHDGRKAVTAARPAMSSKTDKYTIPKKTGVTYFVDDKAKKAGTYKAVNGKALKFTTKASSTSYRLTGATAWSYRF